MRLKLRRKCGRYLHPMWLPLSIEVMGCILLACGIQIERRFHAPVGYLLISEGSFALAVGGLWFAKVSKLLWRKESKDGS